MYPKPTLKLSVSFFPPPSQVTSFVPLSILNAMFSIGFHVIPNKVLLTFPLSLFVLYPASLFESQLDILVHKTKSQFLRS